MNKGPEVSVIVPTRDRWSRLRRTLRSVSAQENVGLELIVVDDCSDEEVPGEIRAEIVSLGKVVRLGERRGTTAALNVGLREARGTWLAFLSDDDLWAPRKLRRQLDEAEERRAKFAYGSVVVVDDDLNVITISRASPTSADIRPSMYTRNPIPAGGSNVIAMADTMQRLGGFDERLPRLADWDMWIRLAESSPGAVCPDVFVAYVLHDENQVVVAEDDSAFRDLAYLLAKHEAARKRLGLNVDVSWFLEWVAGGHRRAGRKWKAARMYVEAGLRSHSAALVARGVGLVLGERALSGSRRLLGLRRPAVTSPDWLDQYRSDEAFHLH